MRSACQKAYDTLSQSGLFFHGSPSSVSYWCVYSSEPNMVVCNALPAPLVAALKRVVVARV